MKIVQRISMWAAALAATGAFAAAGVAFVTDLKGEVAVDGAGRAMLLEELARGQKLSVREGARVAVLFAASGREYVATGPGEYVVKDGEIAATSGIPAQPRQTAWQADPRSVVKVAQTASASVRMRSGAPAAAAPARPVDAQRLRELQGRRPSADAPFTDRVMYGVALQEAGALPEAREWWAQLARERGDLPELEALAR